MGSPRPCHDAPGQHAHCEAIQAVLLPGRLHGDWRAWAAGGRFGTMQGWAVSGCGRESPSPDAGIRSRCRRPGSQPSFLTQPNNTTTTTTTPIRRRAPAHHRPARIHATEHTRPPSQHLCASTSTCADRPPAFLSPARRCDQSPFTARCACCAFALPLLISDCGALCPLESRLHANNTLPRPP
jgi:hypothetical protein